jgi:Catalytic LigB subunit of aromatic ring-opening dioxygenase
MADIVMGLGTSHSPMLNSPAEDYPKHAEIDAKGRRLLDRYGRPTTYGALLEQADPKIAEQITLPVMEQRVAKCTACVEHLSREMLGANLDALIIIGDDQNEQYSDDNMPAILIYSGDTIENNPLHMDADAPEFWRCARSQYHEDSESRSYPVTADLATHMVEYLMDRDFDISFSKRLGKDIGEGHAFGFVHRRLMKDSVLPVIPVAINTYSAPNQPRPRRCYQLGREIRNAVQAATGYERIGILGSGRLSHFYLDQELDHLVLDACKRADAETLSNLPVEKLNSGSSEIRNWIVTAGASEHLHTDWQEYVPCYRSAAGTGYGAGFAVWR